MTLASWLFLLGWCVVVLLVVNALLQGSDILVDDGGITRVFCGVRWKSIEWQDVCRIRLRNMRSFDSGRKIRIICFDTKSAQRQFFGRFGTAFSDEVQNRDAMISLINRYLLKYELSVERGDAAERLCSAQL